MYTHFQVDITDAMATFIDMPVGVLEKCFERLVQDGTIRSTGKNDIFSVCDHKDLSERMEGLAVGEDRASGEGLCDAVITNFRKDYAHETATMLYLYNAWELLFRFHGFRNLGVQCNAVRTANPFREYCER